MSHCVAEDSCVGGFADLSKLSVGVPPVVACGVVPLDVANSTTGFPRLLPLLDVCSAGMNSSEVRDFALRPACK